MVNITLNGKKTAVDEGTILDAIRNSRALYADGCLVALTKDAETIRHETDMFLVSTSKGDIKIQLNNSPISVFWRKIYGSFKGTKTMWVERSNAAIGVVKVPESPDPVSRPRKYVKWDVALGFAGFEKGQVNIIFSILDHEGAYGTPDDGIFGKVVGGKNVLLDLRREDTIVEILPVWQEFSSGYAQAVDPHTEVKEGMNLVTYLEVSIDKKADIIAEYFLTVTSKGVLEVDGTSSSYVRCRGIRDIDIDEKNNDLARHQGCVTVRNSGINEGEIFFYKSDRFPTASHNTVGKIVHGSELISIAGEKSLITIKTDIPRLVVVGMTQTEAEVLLKANGIEVMRIGGKGDTDIIVSQEPSNTLDIKRFEEVNIYGMPDEEVLKVELYTNIAPETVQYFKIVGRMLEKPVGSFNVKFKDRDLGMTVFGHKADFPRPLVPENNPESAVPAYEIGVTNMSRKNAGMIGIRDRDDPTYGPTGEKFEAINIIGKVVGGFDALGKVKKDGVVYMRIVNEGPSG